jgi:TolB-like protein
MKRIVISILLLGVVLIGHAQNPSDKIKIAVLNIESTELMQSAELLGKIARLKLQREDRFSVFREHDVKERFRGRETYYSQCYSINCLSEVGRELGADQMLSGSAERFGERIVINLILIDVKSAKIIASDVNEYYNLGSELEGMIEISINNLLGIKSDPILVNSLVRSETVLTEQVVERLSLNGPRMGASYVYGLRGRRIQDPTEEGGYDALPIMSQFGYQFEWQYLSAGNLQALVEVLPMIGGMDQGLFIPSVTVMNGFRHSRTGIEFAFGPTLRVSREAIGFYNEENVWTRSGEYVPEKRDSYKSGLHENLDSKGYLTLDYSFTMAMGKTIQSGHLNIPINVFYSPSRNGGVVGASFGFNIRKQR